MPQLRVYVPTPGVIRSERNKIQRTWSSREREKRKQQAREVLPIIIAMRDLRSSLGGARNEPFDRVFS